MRGIVASDVPRDAAYTEILMASLTSGELVWDTTEAAAPRWILFLEGPPGDPRCGWTRAISPRPKPPARAN